MGVRTATDILKEGVELAGITYDSTDTKLLKWLKDWLRSVALGWPWPEVTGVHILTLGVGEYSVALGIDGDELTSRYIHRIIFPMHINYGPDILPGKIDQEAFNNITVLSSSVPEGTPTKAAYTKTESQGGVAILFNRKAKTALSIQIDYHWDPAVNLDLDTQPWYPNDETMIQYIAYKTAEYHDGKDATTTKGFADHLSNMLRNDKLKFGNIEDFSIKLSRKFAGK